VILEVLVFILSTLSRVIIIPIRIIFVGIISVKVIYIIISVSVAINIRVTAEVIIVNIILVLSITPPRLSLSSRFLISVNLVYLVGFLVLALL
jgi:hypothetical protein